MNRNVQPCPPWLWPNLVGLDSPAVAVAWQWLFGRVFGANLPPVFHLILGLSVWCVYLADRLYAVTGLIILAAAMAFIGPWQIHLATCLSALSLRMMFHFEDRLSQRTLRVLADAVLLTPLLFAFA